METAGTINLLLTYLEGANLPGVPVKGQCFIDISEILEDVISTWRGVLYSMLPSSASVETFELVKNIADSNPAIGTLAALSVSTDAQYDGKLDIYISKVKEALRNMWCMGDGKDGIIGQLNCIRLGRIPWQNQVDCQKCSEAMSEMVEAMDSSDSSYGEFISKYMSPMKATAQLMKNLRPLELNAPNDQMVEKFIKNATAMRDIIRELHYY